MEPKAICPACGASSSETAKFCLKCGQPLAGPTPKPPTQPSERPSWWRWIGAMAIGAGVVLVAAIILGIVASGFGRARPRTAVLTPSAAPTIDSGTSAPAAQIPPTSSPLEDTPTVLPTTAIPVTDTPVPTASPPPTATPVPTSTPITPTPTPTPSVTPTPSLTPTRRPTPIPYCYYGTLEGIEDYTYPLISIHGVVVNRKGKGVPNVRVRVSAYEWHNDVLTGWDGLFIVDGLSQPLEWTISLPDYNVSVKVPIEKHGQKGVVRFEEKPCR